MSRSSDKLRREFDDVTGDRRVSWDAANKTASCVSSNAHSCRPTKIANSRGDQLRQVFHLNEPAFVTEHANRARKRIFAIPAYKYDRRSASHECGLWPVSYLATRPSAARYLRSSRVKLQQNNKSISSDRHPNVPATVRQNDRHQLFWRVGIEL